jgi:hypothetical protein
MTGVQTCALPISQSGGGFEDLELAQGDVHGAMITLGYGLHHHYEL